MRIYIASPHCLTRFKGGFQIFTELLEGGGSLECALHPYVLESFYYADEDTEKLIPYFNEFMLDSGCFTFMQDAGTTVDWLEYTYQYADFINRNKVEHFVEMDLDYITGYEHVLQLRNILEAQTGKQCIPVWHPSRGLENFKEMCDEYKYVALGGIVGKKWRGMEQYMPWFIKEAHKRGTKIHGLGFTQFSRLKDFHFDSVDSTSWTSGNRFGHLWKFNGEVMVKQEIPKGTRLVKPREAALQNFIEWTKFQRWADTHL